MFNKNSQQYIRILRITCHSIHTGPHGKRTFTRSWNNKKIICIIFSLKLYTSVSICWLLLKVFHGYFTLQFLGLGCWSITRQWHEFLALQMDQDLNLLDSSSLARLQIFGLLNGAFPSYILWHQAVALYLKSLKNLQIVQSLDIKAKSHLNFHSNSICWSFTECTGSSVYMQ